MAVVDSPLRLVGDEGRLRAFVRRHLGMVWGVALFHLGEPREAAEVSRRVIAEALRDIEDVPDPQTLRRWLHGRVLAAVREAVTERSVGAEPVPPDREGPAPGGEPSLDVVAALPADVQRPVILRYFLGQTFASVGARTGLDRDGVDRLLRHAKDLVRPREGP